MSERRSDREGGIEITGSTVTVHGDMVGRDKKVTPAQAGEALQPVAAAVAAAPPEARAEAEAKLALLTAEVAKGKDAADDKLMGKLVGGIVGLVPAAVSAVVAAFGGPILAGVAGPVTEFVLEQLRDP